MDDNFIAGKDLGDLMNKGIHNIFTTISFEQTALYMSKAGSSFSEGDVIGGSWYITNVGAAGIKELWESEIMDPGDAPVSGGILDVIWPIEWISWAIASFISFFWGIFKALIFLLVGIGIISVGLAIMGAITGLFFSVFGIDK